MEQPLLVPLTSSPYAHSAQTYVCNLSYRYIFIIQYYVFLDCLILDCKESNGNNNMRLCYRCAAPLKLKDGKSDIEQKALIMVESWLRALLQVEVVYQSVRNTPAPPDVSSPIKGNSCLFPLCVQIKDNGFPLHYT
jgi:hypothetical protein